MTANPAVSRLPTWTLEAIRWGILPGAGRPRTAIGCKESSLDCGRQGGRAARNESWHAVYGRIPLGTGGRASHATPEREETRSHCAWCRYPTCAIGGRPRYER